MYARQPNMFKRGAHNELGFDWTFDFERSAMVKALCTTSQDRLMNAEDPCCWDHVRLRLGSPFVEDAIHEYWDEIHEMRKERVKEGRRTAERTTMKEDRMEE